MSVVVNNAGGPLKGNNGSDGGIVDEQQVDNRRTSASSAKAIVSRRHSMQMDSDSEKLSRRSSAVATGIGCPRLQLTAIQPISAQGIYHMPDTIDRNHGGVWRRGSRAAVFEAFQVHAKNTMQDMNIPAPFDRIDISQLNPENETNLLPTNEEPAMIMPNSDDPEGSYGDKYESKGPTTQKAVGTVEPLRKEKTINETEEQSGEKATTVAVPQKTGREKGVFRGRAISIDNVAQYMVDTMQRPLIIGWKNGAILPYSLVVRYTLTLLQFIVWYNAVVVPFEIFVFKGGDGNPTLVVLDLLIDCAFTTSVLILLRTGIYLKGELITDRSTLTRMYARSNLVQDLVSMLPFFLDIFVLAMQLPMTFTIRVIRTLRFIRLLSKRIHDSSENGIIQLAGMSMFVAHIVACAYLSFSVLGGDDNDGWKMEPEVLHSSLQHKYLHSLSWALDVMTGFRETPKPQSDLQYLFTTLVFLGGTFLFAYVIGRTGDWVSRRTARKENLDLRLLIMERFIETHQIPNELGFDLLEFYRYTWESMRGFDAASVLQTLPVCIGVDVSSFIYRNHLSKVEFFERMPASVLSELAKRMGMVVRSPGENILVEGQPAFGICFINHGVVDVISRRGVSVNVLRIGEMFGDEVLRSQAVVSNSYVARTFCQLFVLETNDVKAVLAAFPIEAAFMAKMAKGKGGRQKGKGNDNLFEDKDRGKRCRLPLFSPRSFAGSLLASAQKSIALYNAFIILLRIGFEVEGPLLLSALIIDAFVDIISLICIIAHFHQQYSLNGELVYSRNAIAKDYFTGTFAVDLIALLPIHVVSITDPLLRVPRLVGLFRYFVAKENVRSNTTLTKLMMSVTSFCLITHLVSCCYFGMAKIQGFARDDEAFLPSLDVQHQSLFQQYSIATLLTLKILTGRGNKPQAFPESELELVFLILSSMLGLFGVAYLIGEISVLVAHFNPLHFIHQLDVDNINNFMNYKKVPLSLQRRVRSYLDYRWECTQGIGLKGAISDLPRALRLRVLEHVTLQYVRQVPMFSELSENLIQSILECFDYMCIPAQEYVYRKSEMGSNMYIILDGIVALSHSGNDSFYMGPGSFFGEEAILNKIGLRDTSVRTNTGCTLATLTADALEQALESFSEEDQMKIVNELIDPPHDKDSAHEAILNMMDMMVADNFYILNVDSPVSVNLHTGKELFTFIARRLNCTEKNAILFADSLLAKGNLRALGILSPNNHNSEKVALNNPRSETADERPKVAPNTLYRLINFNIAATLDSAGGQDIRAPTEDTSSTSDSATSHRKKTSRTSLSKSQTLLLKASVSYKNLFSKKAGLESPQDTDFSD